MTSRAALQSPASDKQRKFALSLAGDRALAELGDTADQRKQHVMQLFDAPDGFGRVDASVLIERLLAAPRDRSNGPVGARQHVTDESGGPDPAQLVRPGVYRLNDVTYVVKPSRRDPSRVYASALVSAPSDRRMEDGSTEKLELEYARGVIFKLSEQHRLPAVEVAEVSRRYGRCIYCGRTLKVAQSVDRGIGPVCWKRVS